MENTSDELSQALLQMQNNLRKISDEHGERLWLQTGKNILAEKLQGNKSLRQMTMETVDFLVSYSGAQIGTIYTLENKEFRLQYRYGIKGQVEESFKMGEGLIGQAAIKKSVEVINRVPKGYFKIESSLGKERP